tara:strand:+ start:277 stop:507 length:231 start_codon:yes stop_codon:yes gene_type:complete
MTDQIILESVGSYIETDGIIGPLLANGLPDIGVRVHIHDASEEWLESLSDKDRKTVEEIRNELTGDRYNFLERESN